MNIRETLLNFSSKEKKERKQAAKDYFFYLGECEDMEAAKLNADLLGQSWINHDDLDYEPSQVIDNKVKPLIAKQARFMFGRKPDILFKAFDKKDKESCEELRQFIDGILNANKFWSNTLKAFRLATITKRVLLRLEANPNQPVKLFYYSIDEFKYEFDTNDSSKLNSVVFVRQESSTTGKEQGEQIWYRYTYYVKNNATNEALCYLRVETFKGDNLESPIYVEDKNTGLSKIPCWVICNEQSITSVTGASDIKDLKPLQIQINRKLSDFSDALDFLMFGQTAFIDADEDSVNESSISPGSIITLVSIDEKRRASAQRLESNFTNAEPVNMFLDRMENSMYEKLGIPRPEQLQKVPSAKSIKYMFIELIARCDEKWNDWEPVIRSVFRLIVEACSKFDCYKEWNKIWNDMLFSIVLNKNYPVPEDEEDRKRLALEEVQNNVKSHRSYIKEYGNDEDYEEHFKETLEDIKAIKDAETDEFEKDLNSELDAEGNGDE